jgi:nucleoside-diphosphate-sugar epimerase
VNNPNGGLKENVLVFGANGFLGSAVTKKLYGSGYDVLAVIRPGANKSRLCELENLNILEVESSEWPQIVNKHAPTAIICAQWNGVLKQDRGNVELQNSNIQPILNLASSATDSKVRSFVCLGSQAEVMESMESISEEFHDSGESAYGVAKSELHKSLAALFAASDCRLIWARVFSVYGPSDFSDSLLLKLCESQLAQKELVILNPSKLWSYLYEDDFATAIQAIVENVNIVGTVNVANPVFTEIGEIVAIWQENLLRDHRSYDLSRSNSGFFPKLEKLQSVGWSPSVSHQEGIRRTRIAFTDRINSK